MNKHTPGPWHMSPAFFDQKKEEPWFRVYGSHTLFLNVRADCDGYVKGANEANARLIAAAPDMLEVLQEIVRLWDHHCYAHGDGIPSPLHIKARAAITKATGDTQ